MDKPAQSADHCPLKKPSEHCNKTKEDPSPAFSANRGGIDCCPMTVSFFAGPIEKNSFSVKQAPALAIVAPASIVFTFQSATPLHSSITYRGPPPIDRRVDRIKHRVLLI